MNSDYVLFEKLFNEFLTIDPNFTYESDRSSPRFSITHDIMNGHPFFSVKFSTGMAFGSGLSKMITVNYLNAQGEITIYLNNDTYKGFRVEDGSDLMLKLKEHYSNAVDNLSEILP